jgi:hypothetical protein
LFTISEKTKAEGRLAVYAMLLTIIAYTILGALNASASERIPDEVYGYLDQLHQEADYHREQIDLLKTEYNRVVEGLQ